jgi:hypothetical protein
MNDYELDLSGKISEEQIREALANYNAMHSNSFTLSGSGQKYSLIGGDETYCEGDLQQIAYFWEGYVSGQSESENTFNLDPSDEGLPRS